MILFLGGHVSKIQFEVLGLFFEVICEIDIDPVVVLGGGWDSEGEDVVFWAVDYGEDGFAVECGVCAFFVHGEAVGEGAVGEVAEGLLEDGFHDVATDFSLIGLGEGGEHFVAA